MNWYQEKELKNIFDFTKETITSNTTIYVKWRTNSFTLTFNSKGGTETAQQTIKNGEKAKIPIDPNRLDYFFKGWYKEEALINSFDFTKETIDANTTVYAKWEKINKLVFSTTPVVSSLQLEISSTLQITNIGAVIRLATEAIPTKAQAEANVGFVNLRIDSDSTRKFSISQHYGSDFTNGLTLDDVLAPNTNYKLYLFFEPNVIPSETLIEGATLTNDVIALSFTTAMLPFAGDVAWNNAWINNQFVGSLSEWGYSENQKGIFVAYTKINLSSPTGSMSFTSRTTNNIFFKPIGTFSLGSAIPDSNFFFNLSKLGGSYPNTDNYYYLISTDKTGRISGKTLQLEITAGSMIVKLKTPLIRYNRP